MRCDGDFPLMKVFVCILHDPMLSLEQRQLVADALPVAAHKLPGQARGVVHGQLAEAVVLLVEDGGEVERLLAGGQGGVGFDVAGHAVDDVRHGRARVGAVGGVVDDRRRVDGAVGAERPEPLVPVDVAGEVGVDAVREQQGLEGGAHVALVGRGGGGVHGPVAHGDDPRRLGAVDGGEVGGEPLDLLVGGVGLPVVVVDAAEGARVGDEGLALGRQGLGAVQVAQEGVLGAVGEVGLAVERDEVREAVVEGVPEVADAARLGAGHAEAVLVAEVGEGGVGGGRVGLVVVQVGGQDVAGPVELGTRGLVVAGDGHVGDLAGELVHPLLPQVPVGLVEHAHVAAQGPALVRDLASGQRRLVLGGDGRAAGQLGRGAVVADGPVALTRQDAGVPVVGVGDVAAVPGEGEPLVGGLDQLLVGAVGIGVAHVVEDGDGEGALVPGGVGGPEVQDVGGGGAVGGIDLVVVGGGGLQVVELDVVVELAALGDDDGGTGGRAVVGLGLAGGAVAQVLGRGTPLDLGGPAQAEGGLEVDVDALGEVGGGDDVDVVGGLARGGLDGGRLDETREAFAVAIDGGIDPVADGHGGTGVGEAGVDVGVGVGLGGGVHDGRREDGGAEEDDTGGGLHRCGGAEGDQRGSTAVELQRRETDEAPGGSVGRTSVEGLYTYLTYRAVRWPLALLGRLTPRRPTPPRDGWRVEPCRCSRPCHPWTGEGRCSAASNGDRTAPNEHPADDNVKSTAGQAQPSCLATLSKLMEASWSTASAGYSPANHAAPFDGPILPLPTPSHEHDMPRPRSSTPPFSSTATHSHPLSLSRMATPLRLHHIDPPGALLAAYDRHAPPATQPHPAAIPPLFLDAMTIRETVFCHEQAIALANEFDADDPRSHHWVLYHHPADPAAPSAVPAGTVRLVPPPHPTDPAAASHDTTTEPYLKLGRLAVQRAFRKRGVAAPLIDAALAFAARHPARVAPPSSSPPWRGLVLVHAQTPLEPYYARWGFVRDAAMGSWDEEGIMHVGMWKRLDVRAAGEEEGEGSAGADEVAVAGEDGQVPSRGQAEDLERRWTSVPHRTGGIAGLMIRACSELQSRPGPHRLAAGGPVARRLCSLAAAPTRSVCE
nr:hypothetical protein CFP56_46614 [Quercus suber]